MFGYGSLERKVLKVVAKDEKHAPIGVVSSLDLLYMQKKRFLLMQEILAPLIEALNKELEVKNIYFVDGLNGNFSINIEYKKNDKTGYIILNQVDIHDIEISLDTNHNTDLIKKNKKIIIDVFQKGSKESFNEKSVITSTGNNFSLTIFNNLFEVYSINIRDLSNYFKISYDFLENNSVVNQFKVATDSYKIKECLPNDERIKEFLNHIKVYKNDIPRYLVKR